MNENFHRDVAQFKHFVDKFKGKAFFVKEKVHGSVYLNICLMGMGAIFGNEVYSPNGKI